MKRPKKPETDKQDKQDNQLEQVDEKELEQVSGGAIRYTPPSYRDDYGDRTGS